MLLYTSIAPLPRLLTLPGNLQHHEQYQYPVETSCNIFHSDKQAAQSLPYKQNQLCILHQLEGAHLL